MTNYIILPQVTSKLKRSAPGSNHIKKLLLFFLLLLSTPLSISCETPRKDQTVKPHSSSTNTAVFAAGCFWCIQPPFDKAPGVISTTVGYSGGPEKEPAYSQVSSGQTGHVEAIQVKYDPKITSYKELLQIYWKNIDPTTSAGQFCDIGLHYRPVIFYKNKAQMQVVAESKKAAKKQLKVDLPIKVEISQSSPFYPAEDYHQSYYKKNPFRYKRYRIGCGRDARLKELWGD